VKAKQYKLCELKDAIIKHHNKYFTNMTTTNVDVHVQTIHNIATTFANNNTTTSWYSWLDNKITAEQAQNAIDSIHANNHEVIRVSNIVRAVFEAELAPILDTIAILQAVEEELSSVMMYPRGSYL
jgi:hypothetical protein